MFGVIIALDTTLERLNMRVLFEVVEKIIPLVPEHRTEFIQALNSVRISVAFAPPEMMDFWWRECAGVLQEHMAEEEAIQFDWEKEIVKIWQDKP